MSYWTTIILLLVFLSVLSHLYNSYLSGEEVTAESLGLPRTTDDCGWDTGLACAGDIGSAVLDCAGIFVNPLEIVSCVQDAIGAGHDCWPCICWVIEWVLGDGYCGDL